MKLIKKIAAGAIAVAAAVSCLVYPYSALDIIIDESDIIWEETSDGTVRVTGYVGEETDFVVPEEIEGKTVTEVAIRYWNQAYKCKSITIPATVTYITAWDTASDSIAEIKVAEENENYLAEDGVLYTKDKTVMVSYPAGKTDEVFVVPDTVEHFANLNGVSIASRFLKEIEIPESFIGTNISFSCEVLEAVNVNENNQSYASDDGVLFSKDMTALYIYPRYKPNTSYTIPNSVETIERLAFNGNRYLTSIDFPDSVTYLQFGSFFYCHSLVSVTLPAGLQNMDGKVFSYCENLAEIKLDPNNPYLVIENGALFDKEMTKLFMYLPGNTDTSFEIPEGVTTICQNAFVDTDNLISITIPDTVTYLNERAFGYMENLTSIEIPDSVTEMGNMIFDNCISLSDIKIGSGIKTITMYCFSNCMALTEVVIPEGVTLIEGYAFVGCTSLVSVTIPASVEFIGYTWANTEVELFGYWHSSDVTVYGIEGSYTESYCARMGYNFNGKLEPIVDEETNIALIAEPYAVDEGTQLKVEPIANEDPEDDSVRFDISLVDEDGEETQPKEGKSVLVRVPVPEGMNPEACRIYRAEYNEDGTEIIRYTSMKPKVVYVNGTAFLEFSTSHFSEYVITTKQLAPDGMLGDINSDSKVTIADARMLLQAASGSRVLTEEQEAVADVNGDGKITIADARWLLQVASGSRVLDNY